MRRGARTEQATHRLARPGALDVLASNPWTIDIGLAARVTLNQLLLTQTINDLRGRRVGQAIALIQQVVELAHGGFTELPQLTENVVFEIVGNAGLARCEWNRRVVMKMSYSTGRQ